MSGILNSRGITVRKGDSFTIVLRFKTEQGLLDISNAKIKMDVKDMDNKLLFSKAGQITDALNGLAGIELTPQDTNLEEGDYKTDSQITYANGQVHTIFPQDINKVAYFKVTGQVTE